MLRYFSLLMLFMGSTWLWAAEYDVYTTMDHLYAESKQDRSVIADEYERDRIVKHFVKKLSKLDDKGLGDINSDKNPDDLFALKREIEDLTYTYTHKVRPVLLNNIKLNRQDNGAKMNKGDLSKLMFTTKYNHKTGKPISGIFSYQQDIDDSLFGEKLVQAGLLVNFPKLKEESWVKQALKMDTELVAFRRMHLAYMDGAHFSRPKFKKSLVQKNTKYKQNTTSDWSIYKREKEVRKFVHKMKKLDNKQPFSAFKQDLVALLETFEQTVKPILIDNINLQRFDIGAKVNKGDLIALFYPNNKNYYTGKPVSSKLSHGGSSKHDIGYLVAQPELAQDDVVKRALVMEAELAKLLQEHKTYLERDKNFLMW